MVNCLSRVEVRARLWGFRGDNGDVPGMRFAPSGLRLLSWSDLTAISRADQIWRDDERFDIWKWVQNFAEHPDGNLNIPLKRGRDYLQRFQIGQEVLILRK